MKRALYGAAVLAATAWAQAQQPGSSGALPPEPPAPPPAPPAPPPAPAPSAAPTESAPLSPQAPPATASPAAHPPPAGYYPPPGAYPPPPPPAPPPEPVRNVSLTLSPVHLLAPVLELTGEVRVVNHFGVAAIGGYGSLTVEGERFKVWELGGQLLAYPMNPFHGLHLGAELLYVKVDANDLQSGTVRGSGNGLAVGPLVGYKVLTGGGFTFVVQGGVQYIAARAEASDSAGNSAEADDQKFIALLNLNLGYSF
jgi:hypothetical protein